MKPGNYTIDDLSVTVSIDKKDKKLGAVAGNGKWIIAVSAPGRSPLGKRAHDLPLPDDDDLAAHVQQLVPSLLLLKTDYREKRAYLSYEGIKLFWFDAWVSTTTKFAECSLLTCDELKRLSEWAEGQQTGATEALDEEGT